jgi:hypothetical protein
MALNRPFGLSPARSGVAADYNAQVQKYRIPSTDGSAFYIGDAVLAAAGADTNGIPNVAKATSAQTLRGVIVGVENPSVNVASLAGTVIDDTVTNVPATKTRDYYVWVCDDPNQLFMIQDDGITTGNLVAASANLNFVLTITAPSLGYQLSGTVMLSSSLATTNTLNMKAIGLAQLPAIAGGGANAFGAYAVWMCKINEHELMGAQAGV